MEKLIIYLYHGGLRQNLRFLFLQFGDLSLECFEYFDIFLHTGCLLNICLVLLGESLLRLNQFTVLGVKIVKSFLYFFGLQLDLVIVLLELLYFLELFIDFILIQCILLSKVVDLFIQVSCFFLQIFYCRLKLSILSL